LVEIDELAVFPMLYLSEIMSTLVCIMTNNPLWISADTNKDDLE